MLKLVLSAKAVIYFSVFKLLPSFLILSAGLESDTSVVELVSSPDQEISIDSGTSAYAIIEDSLFLAEDILVNNVSLKNIETPLYAVSFLKAHKNFAASTPKVTRNIQSIFSDELVTGNLFNWSAWYTEIDQNGGGITVDQKRSQLLIASTDFKAAIQKKSKINKSPISKLSGKFLLKDGLFINSAEVFIYQTLNGLKVSEAKINYQKATFSFKSLVPGGYIIAELKSRLGELIGLSEVSVNRLGSTLVLKIRDVSRGLKGEALSSKSLWGGSLSSIKSKLNANFYVESLDRKILKSNGLYRDVNLSDHSNYLLGSYHSQHWPSLYFGNTFSLNSLYSFSNSMISSVLYLLGWDLEISSKPSIILGRVSYKGRPVSGARLQLYDSNIKPIYFDKWIPSKELVSTSSSGLFAFVGLESGVSSIGVQFARHSYNSKFVPVQSGKVSFVDFIESEGRKKQMLSYDLFSKNFVQTKVKLLGTDKVSLVAGDSVANVPQQRGGENLQLFEVEAKNADYQPVSVLSFSNENQLEIPMIRKSWINRIAKNIKLTARESILVGISEKAATFSINIKPLLESSPYLTSNLVYFDKKSQIYKLPNIKTIGFVAFNLPRGLYSANLVTRGNSALKTTTRLVISEPKSVQILKF